MGFLKDGESVRFIGNDTALSALQKAVAAGAAPIGPTTAPLRVSAPAARAKATTGHQQGDITSQIYVDYARRMEDAWRDTQGWK